MLFLLSNIDCVSRNTIKRYHFFQSMSCRSCGSTDFTFADDRYIVCRACGQQDSDNPTADDEVDVDREGKNRFGIVTRSEVPMIDAQGNLLLDMSMPFERPSKLSVGSVGTDKSSQKQTKRARVHRFIEEILIRLVDPLAPLHCVDVVCRVRKTCHGMFSHVLQDPIHSMDSIERRKTKKRKARTGDDNEEDDGLEEEEDDDNDDVFESELKNRGMRKKAIFVHIALRVVFHFLPEFDEKRYRNDVILPFFGGRLMHDIKKCLKFIYKYGLPVTRRIFPEFDRLHEHDYNIHLQCKVRRLFLSIAERGRYGAVLSTERFRVLFDGAGLIVFHPEVISTLQNWKFWTRVGTLLCILKVTEPEEVARFIRELDDEPVKEVTIVSHLQDVKALAIVQGAFESSPAWKKAFDDFYTERPFLCTTSPSSTSSTFSVKSY